MEWISEMFANMEKNKVAALAKRGAKAAKAPRTEHLTKADPGRPGRVECSCFLNCE